MCAKVPADLPSREAPMAPRPSITYPGSMSCPQRGQFVSVKGQGAASSSTTRLRRPTWRMSHHRNPSAATLAAATRNTGVNPDKASDSVGLAVKADRR